MTEDELCCSSSSDASLPKDFGRYCLRNQNLASGLPSQHRKEDRPSKQKSGRADQFQEQIGYKSNRTKVNFGEINTVSKDTTSSHTALPEVSSTMLQGTREWGVTEQPSTRALRSAMALQARREWASTSSGRSP